MTPMWLEHDGLVLSVRDWAARLAIPRNTLYARLRNGWSVADTISTRAGAPRPGRPVKPSTRTITHGGLTLTVVQWARRLGVSSQCLHNRLRLGWSEIDALTRPLRPVKAASRARRPLAAVSLE